MILTKERIKDLGIITPFQEKVKCPISYGAEPNGYTLSLSDEFWIPSDRGIVLDPFNKTDSQKVFDIIHADSIILEPKHFILAKSKEYIKMPNNVSAIALTKSTYARIGVFANITTIDAGWEGYLTIEIANIGNLPVKIYADYGIAEMIFMEHENTEGYEGNYQKLKGIKI